MGDKARLVVARHETGGGTLPAVQDVATGLVYPFASRETCAHVVADVNAGRDSLLRYGSLFGSFVIEEVA